MLNRNKIKFKNAKKIKMQEIKRKGQPKGQRLSKGQDFEGTEKRGRRKE